MFDQQNFASLQRCLTTANTALQKDPALINFFYTNSPSPIE